VRSASNAIARVMLALLVIAAGPVVAYPAAQEQLRAPATQPTDAEIAGALSRVKADPNLATQQTIKTLRWKDAETPRTETPSWLAWLSWFKDLFRWVDRSARVLMWCSIGVLAAWLAFYLARMLRDRQSSPHEDRFVAPTHVRDLDIRPEALPANIGAAARQLWDRGEQRAALALLYRGLLSRLAHVHRVPIRDASTEGDCLALAAAHLPHTRSDYVVRLVSTWQRFVYGRLDVQTASVHSLCDDFRAALDANTGAPAARGDAR
jgi:hypothetical protein